MTCPRSQAAKQIEGSPGSRTQPSAPTTLLCKAVQVRLVGAGSADGARDRLALGGLVPLPWKQLAKYFDLIDTGKCKQKGDGARLGPPDPAPRLPLVWHEVFLCGVC